jgi:hypothetical protein
MADSSRTGRLEPLVGLQQIGAVVGRPRAAQERQQRRVDCVLRRGLGASQASDGRRDRPQAGDQDERDPARVAASIAPASRQPPVGEAVVAELALANAGDPVDPRRGLADLEARLEQAAVDRDRWGGGRRASSPGAVSARAIVPRGRAPR